jgi:hypothetical protein
MPDAGWYRDPAGSAQQRWWDGQAWTAHLRDPPAPAPTASYPAPAAPSAPPAPPAAPATPSYGPAPAPPSAGPAAPPSMYAPSTTAAPAAPPTYPSAAPPAPTAPAASPSAPPAGPSWPTGTQTAPYSNGGSAAGPAAYGGSAGGTPNRSSRPNRLRVWHLIVVGVAAFIIGLLLGNSGGKSSPSPNATAGRSTSTTVSAGGASGSSSTTSALTASTYAIGQTAKIPGWSVTVYAVHSPQPPGTSAEPPAGFHFVSVDVAVLNTSTLAETWSSTTSLHLLDAASRKYAVTPTDIRPPVPAGVIQKGVTMRGLAVFAVPNATTVGLRLLVQGSATATGVTFKLS